MNAKIVELLKKKRIRLIEIKVIINPVDKAYVDGLVGWERSGKATSGHLVVKG